MCSRPAIRDRRAPRFLRAGRRAPRRRSREVFACTPNFGKLFASASIYVPAQQKERIVSTEVQLELDESLQRRFGTVADDARATRTAAALEANGIRALRAANAAEAKRIVLGLIPDGVQVHSGASQSLEASGII